MNKLPLWLVVERGALFHGSIPPSLPFLQILFVCALFGIANTHGLPAPARARPSNPSRRPPRGPRPSVRPSYYSRSHGFRFLPNRH